MNLRPLLLPFVLGSLVLFAVAAALFAVGRIGIGPLMAAFACAAACEVLMLRLYLDGFHGLRRAIVRLARNIEEPPEVEFASPAIDTVWRNSLRVAAAGNRRAQNLRKELEGVTEILTTFPDPLLLINARRQIVDANAAARELFGEALVRRDLSAAIRNPGILDAADAVLRGGEGAVIEFEVAAPVERQFSARVLALPRAKIGHEDDSIIELGDEDRDLEIFPVDPGVQDRERPVALIVLHDLTALKRTEQMRVDFVANASHELRTPLSALLGFIETLQGPAADDYDAQKRFLGIMHEQAARMTRLVEDLLSLSRIEMNEHLVPTNHVSIASILNNLIQSLELKAAARSITMELRLGAADEEVVGDSDELLQVFQNLIDNALKYGRPNSTVTISTGPSSRIRSGLAVSVSDQGDGIPRMHLPRLTERFYRVDTARSRRLGGTGLGLAIVKHIVNRHRGFLEIDSEIGVGSVFTVHLRLGQAAGQHGGQTEQLRRVATDTI